MLKISFTGCPALSSTISAQFIFKMCVAAQNRENFTETLSFADLRSFRVIDVNTLKKLVTSACLVCLSVTVFAIGEPIAVK